MSTTKNFTGKVVLTQSQFDEKQSAGTLQEGVEYEISDYEEPVLDVQINSTSILSSGVANISYASQSQGGVIRVNPSLGLAIYPSGSTSEGQVYVVRATDSEVSGKSNSIRPIVPSTIELAIKAGLGSYNGAEFDGTEKATARNTIGAVALEEYDSTASSYDSGVLYYVTE